MVVLMSLTSPTLNKPNGKSAAMVTSLQYRVADRTPPASPQINPARWPGWAVAVMWRNVMWRKIGVFGATGSPG